MDRFDGFQRRHSVLGFPLGVVYKFFDDQGPYLAAILTYYAFIAIFPALLLASSLLGFILQGNPDLQTELLELRARARSPIVGPARPTPRGSLAARQRAWCVGSLAALYGVLGLGQAGQHALSTAWGVPRNSRFNPFVRRARSLVLDHGRGPGSARSSPHYRWWRPTSAPYGSTPGYGGSGP